MTRGGDGLHHGVLPDGRDFSCDLRDMRTVTYENHGGVFVETSRTCQQPDVVEAEVDVTFDGVLVEGTVECPIEKPCLACRAGRAVVTLQKALEALRALVTGAVKGGKENERGAIVAWLRRLATDIPGSSYWDIADAIEKGEHLR
jgi:hypothetical protein